MWWHLISVVYSGEYFGDNLFVSLMQGFLVCK